MTWRIELSRPAVRALRSLPRDEQRLVAARIRVLEKGGPPPGVQADAPFEIPAGRQSLVCMPDREARRLVVVTLRAAQAPAGRAVAGLLGRLFGRWVDFWKGGGGMGALGQDLGFALRALRKAPGFSVVAVLTLALGIGAATAIFSVADGVLLTPLPYGDPDRVVTVWSSWVSFPDKTWVSVGEYQAWVQDSRSFEDLALYYTGSASFTDPDRPERVGAAGVTPNTWSTLGVAPVLGRAFTWEEARAQAQVVLLGHDVWLRRFDGDPGVVGRAVQIDGTSRTVLGVLPRGFALPVDYGSASASQVFEPLFVDRDAPDPVRTNGGNHGSYVVGRLKPGVTVAQARADLIAQADRWVAEGSRRAEMHYVPRVFAAKDDIVGTARGTILVLLGAVAFVLLIACGNVANLLLSRSEARRGEISVRAALGAGRVRLVRQLLTESLALSLFGGALGLALAVVGVRALLAVDPSAVPRADDIHVSGPVLAFALGASVLTALLFGVAPALRTSRGHEGRALTDRARGAGSGARSNRTQGLLTAAQMAMAVLLLTGCGLMVRTFVGLLSVDPGFHAERVVTMRLSAPGASYPERSDVVAFYQELLRRIRALPQVDAAGAVRLLPLASTMGDSGLRVEGYVPAPDEATQADWQWATPGYFEVMGIPILEGRAFREGDDADGQQVILINQSLARHYFGDRSPLGAHVSVFDGRLNSSDHRDWATVVGVVADVRHNGITAQAKERFYRPHAQVASSMRSMTLTIRARSGDPSDVVEPVRRVVASMDPRMPVAEVRTMDQVMAGSVAQPRFAMLLLAAFAAVALALAVVGIYGVLAYAVSRRTPEIGIRMALGADRPRVVRMVVRQGMGMALAGVAVGMGAALGMTRFMQGMLFGVTPLDPLTFATVPVLFGAVALFACWIPAARAARVHPSEALRAE
jgi:putative ABC transport system permease protein